MGHLAVGHLHDDVVLVERTHAEDLGCLGTQRRHHSDGENAQRTA